MIFLIYLLGKKILKWYLLVCFFLIVLIGVCWSICYFILSCCRIWHKYIKLTFQLFKDDVVNLFLPLVFSGLMILLIYARFTPYEVFNVLIKSLWFIMLYIVFLSSNTILRCFLLIFSYIGVGYVLTYSIGSLHPLVGKIFESPLDQDKFCIALSLVYTILMILVLFSLQKTARKNSIVAH